MAQADTRKSVDSLPILADLVSAIGAESPRVFHDRICEAICQLTPLERASLLLYDEARKLVAPAGSYRVDEEILLELYGTLDETPIAQRALSEDQVIAASDLTGEIPERHRHLPNVSTLVCAPVSVGGRWLGVIFGDCDGRQIELSDDEMHTFLLLAKTAAFAAWIRQATTQHERARQLSQHVGLQREVHDRVMQRLFGVSLVLGSDVVLDADGQRRAADELQAALADLRTAMQRTPDPVRSPSGMTLRGELERLGHHYRDLQLDVRWQAGVEIPEESEPLAQAVLAEALRNATKHAAATRSTITVQTAGGALELEIRNDGVGGSSDPAGPNGAGMGLRLAAFEALQRGGLLEFGPAGEEEWRVRLVVPIDEVAR